MIPTTLKKFQVSFRFLSLKKNSDQYTLMSVKLFSQTYQYYCNEIIVCLMYRAL